MVSILENVVYQHVENACSLWWQRQIALYEPHYSFKDLVEIDSRLEANIDGIRLAGPQSHAMISEMLDLDDEGALFTESVISIESNIRDIIHARVDQAVVDSQQFAEIESALAWVDSSCLTDIVKELLTSTNSTSNVLGFRVCTSHLKNPGRYLDLHLNNPDPLVRCAALRCGSELRLAGILEKTRQLSPSEPSISENFERGRVFAILGSHRESINCLYPVALSDSPSSSLAVDIIMQMGDRNAAKSLLKTLEGIKGRERDVIRGFGLLGDPVAIDWLLQKTETFETSRIAGESISMITGVDIINDGLEKLSDSLSSSIDIDTVNEDKDNEDILIDEDENLPWPDLELLSKQLAHTVSLGTGGLFLAGKVRSERTFKFVILNGMQRQRNAAAVSLAIANRNSIWFDSRLPTNKQAQRMMEL